MRVRTRNTPAITSVALTSFVFAIMSSGCNASKEERACEQRMVWTAKVAQAMGESSIPEKMSAPALAECIAGHQRAKERLSLSEAEYETYLDCEIAADTLEASMQCSTPGAANASTKQVTPPGPPEPDAR